VNGEHTVLVADRNPHVREFLRRELTASGYRVLLARNARDLQQQLLSPEAIHLLILDPDLPDIEGLSLAQIISRRSPPLPVVFHALPDDLRDWQQWFRSVTFVEKAGGSVEDLKTAVADMLRRHLPATTAHPKAGREPGERQ
jgi:DNA-binding NtrC family response regulator